MNTKEEKKRETETCGQPTQKRQRRRKQTGEEREREREMGEERRQVTWNTDKEKKLIQGARRGHAAESESLEKRQTTSRVLRNGNERRGGERRRYEDRKRERKGQTKRVEESTNEKKKKKKREQRYSPPLCTYPKVYSRSADGHGAKNDGEVKFDAIHSLQGRIRRGAFWRCVQALRLGPSSCTSTRWWYGVGRAHDARCVCVHPELSSSPAFCEVGLREICDWPSGCASHVEE